MQAMWNEQLCVKGVLTHGLTIQASTQALLLSVGACSCLEQLWDG